MARKVLARIEKPAPTAATTPTLPGLQPATTTDVISMKAAAQLLGCKWDKRRLAMLGLDPISETCTGTLTFRAYNRAAVLAVKANQDRLKQERIDRAKAEAQRRAEIAATVNRTLQESGVFPANPMAPPPPQPAQPEPPTILRQQLALLCEIRDLLKQTQRAS